MPIQTCMIDDKPGYQWGDSGTCYLISEHGEDGAKQKAIDQALAAGATADEFRGADDAAELATLHDVPILSVGTHRSHNKGALTVSEEMLNEIVEGSNALAPVVKESLETGTYRGNESLNLKKMPGIVNLLHDAILDDTIKTRVKDVEATYGKKDINGVSWMTGTFRNVPNDVARSIKTHFPFRSVELVPLKDPETGKAYPLVVRSTAFLDRYTPPAVKGQTADVAVEFAREDPVITLITAENTNTHIEEDSIMSNDAQKQTTQPDVSVIEPNTLDSELVAELQARYDEAANALKEKEAEIAKLKAQQGEVTTELKAWQAETESLKAQQQQTAAELQAMLDRQEEQKVVEFMKDLRGMTLKGADGVVYNPSPAFCDLVHPVISATSPGIVVELAEGQSEPARQALMKMVTSVIELAAHDGGMLVALGNIAPQTHEPEHTDKPKDVMELMAELREKNPDLTEGQAWTKAHEQLGTYEEV